MTTPHPSLIPHSNLILVVDDNPTNARVLFDLLEAAGLRVFLAQSGESALDKLQIITPDLILLDVMMPGIDGFETCRRIKASTATTNDCGLLRQRMLMTDLKPSVTSSSGSSHKTTLGTT